MHVILKNVLKHISYEERSEEDYPIKCLRQEVAKWACILKNPKCLKTAKSKLEQHLIHHAKLLPWWKEWTYCKGLMKKKNLIGIWKKALEKGMLNFDKRIFKFLTCIEHPNSIKEYLDIDNPKAIAFIKNISLQFRDIDRVNRFLFIIIKHAKKDEILEYILNNFKELIPREVNTVASLIIIINHVYFLEQLKKTEEFVKNYLKKDEIMVKNYLKENLFFRNEFDKIHECAKNFINERISFIYRKIEKRTSEILHLLKQVKNMVKI